MKECVACDKHQDYYDDERLFDAVRTWLWEEAPYVLTAFPAIKYSAKNPESGSTMLCRRCLIQHVADWLDQIEAPLGVKQQFRTYFHTHPVRRDPIKAEPVKEQQYVDH